MVEAFWQEGWVEAFQDKTRTPGKMRREGGSLLW